MRAEFGARSYCWLIDALEILASIGGRLQIPNVDKYLAREFDEATDDEVHAWLELCDELGLLSIGDSVTSPLLDESFGYAQATSERGKRGAQAKLKQCSSAAQAEHAGSLSLSNSSSISSSSFLPKEGIQGEPFTLPKAFDTPEIRKALAAWDGKLRANKAKPRALDQFQVDALCIKFREPKALLDALVHSCSLSSTTNVYAMPEEKKPPSDPPKHNKSVAKVLELLEQDRLEKQGRVGDGTR